MAKSATKTAGKQRVSTRRILRTRKKGRANRSRARRQPAALTAATAETLQVQFELRDVSERLLRDPETFFTFRRVSDRRQIGDQIALPLTGQVVNFSVPVATGQVLVCEIDPKRYRFAHSPVFFGSPGPRVIKEAQLLREPKEWTPRFTRWDDLGDTFESLVKVLGQSPKVTLFKDDQPIADRLVGAAYDNMSGEQATLAKTALLNSYFKLSHTLEPVSGERSWFSFVSRVLAIGRERFLAFVEPDMATLVEQIHDNIDEFRADYERTNAENHRGNVPAPLRNRITKMISIKSTERKGNLQLTISCLENPDQVLLDTDIDENGDLLGHVADLFKHKINGGTHPHDIHELLVLQDGEEPGFDLGYELV